MLRTILAMAADLVVAALRLAFVAAAAALVVASLCVALSPPIRRALEVLVDAGGP